MATRQIVLTTRIQAIFQPMKSGGLFMPESISEARQQHARVIRKCTEISA